ncbi:hypothetical protein QVD99_006871 [Batrachochytrium dendrobatidis]|nr:hypothetical protein O5D80_007895 [Batrachochytrium dendrobatidis]KAK5666093.1 hypothetical protein QVD99_006871 [Batrachochytrium dendrobatidis]
MLYIQSMNPPHNLCRSDDHCFDFPAPTVPTSHLTTTKSATPNPASGSITDNHATDSTGGYPIHKAADLLPYPLYNQIQSKATVWPQSQLPLHDNQPRNTVEFDFQPYIFNKQLDQHSDWLPSVTSMTAGQLYTTFPTPPLMPHFQIDSLSQQQLAHSLLPRSAASHTHMSVANPDNSTVATKPFSSSDTASISGSSVPSAQTSPESLLYAMLNHPPPLTINIDDPLGWSPLINTPVMLNDAANVSLSTNNIMQSILHTPLIPMTLPMLPLEHTDNATASSAISSTPLVTLNDNYPVLDQSMLALNHLDATHPNSLNGSPSNLILNGLNDTWDIKSNSMSSTANSLKWSCLPSSQYPLVDGSPARCQTFFNPSTSVDFTRARSASTSFLELPISTTFYSGSDCSDLSERTEDRSANSNSKLQLLEPSPPLTAVGSGVPATFPSAKGNSNLKFPSPKTTADSAGESSCVPPSRRYYCTFSGCDRWFTRKNNLDAHYRTHTGERPSACTECDKTFNRKHDLSRHISSVHFKSDRYGPCVKCGARFPRQDAFKRHMYSCSRHPE